MAVLGDCLATPPESRLPRLVEGIDVRNLPIGPAEAFVLSYVDGTANEAEIADEAGLQLETLAGTLEELARLGAVWFDRPKVRSSMRAPHIVSGASRVLPIFETKDQQPPQHPAAALYDARELEEAVDIELERKRTILEAFYRLESLTHYQLLHVEPTADKRAIKNAYFEIVNVFHPDRYFGKKLGSFKSKLERVFTRLTEAHDVLTRVAPRAEYDAYLASLQKTRTFDQPDDAVQAQILAIQRQIEEEAAAAEHSLSQGSRSASTHPISSQQSQPPKAAGTTNPPSDSRSRPPSQRPSSDDARRRALARKLGGRNVSGSMPAATSHSIPPPSAPRTDARERAVKDLKERYEQRVTRARVDRAERYLVNARQSLANKDPISAANALRIAASLVPDHAEVTARLEQAQNEAEALLSSHYLTQAEYEERDGRLLEAARSYARASVGDPKARTFERAAYCALLAAGDLRLAGDHARRAVALAPEDAQARVTLARIYVAAGMKQSGLAEFERAATFAPKDDTIRDWIRRLKRGEA